MKVKISVKQMKFYIVKTNAILIRLSCEIILNSCNQNAEVLMIEACHQIAKLNSAGGEE